MIMFSIEAACCCHTGKIRLNNEDNFLFDGKYLPAENKGAEGVISMLRRELSSPVSFGVFDGMGGEQYGEQAAYVAAVAFNKAIGLSTASTHDTHRKRQIKKRYGNPVELLKDACLTANSRICGLSSEHNDVRIGTTVAAMVYFDTSAWLCNVGDSKIFHIAGDRLQQLSVDHTNQDFLQRHGITDRRPALTQHLGIMPDEMLIEPYIAQIELNSSDIFIVCSDGLTDMLSTGEIAAVASNGTSVEERVSILIEQSLSRGGRDNITVILCAISG